MARVQTNTDRIKKLTEEEFKQLRPKLTRLSSGALDVAYAVLVDGKNQSEVARETGRSRSSVQNICKRVLDRVEDVPVGWATAEICLPPDLLEKVFQMEKEARLAYEAAKK